MDDYQLVGVMRVLNPHLFGIGISSEMFDRVNNNIATELFSMEQQVIGLTSRYKTYRAKASLNKRLYWRLNGKSFFNIWLDDTGWHDSPSPIAGLVLPVFGISAAYAHLDYGHHQLDDIFTSIMYSDEKAIPRILVYINDHSSAMGLTEFLGLRPHQLRYEVEGHDAPLSLQELMQRQVITRLECLEYRIDDMSSLTEDVDRVLDKYQ